LNLSCNVWNTTKSEGVTILISKHAMKIFYITLAISICLIVGGFLCPPIGVVDGSVLTAVGELLLSPLIIKLPEAIKAGRNIRIRRGPFEVEVNSPDDDKTANVNC